MAMGPAWLDIQLSESKKRKTQNSWEEVFPDTLKRISDVVLRPKIKRFVSFDA
jgi:hypothetical protein